MTSWRRQEYFRNRIAKKKEMRISFHTFDELESLRNEKKFKIHFRSALGVQTLEEEWVQSFNIGNLMHLQPVSFDDFNDRSMFREFRDEQKEFTQFVTEEITKDKLLNKAIFVIASYFCVGTELRFLAMLNSKHLTQKDSEMWHAKAIHIAAAFLPSDCPLIQHILQSYSKHHLRPKIKRR
jgi:hypothetical protein